MFRPESWLKDKLSNNTGNQDLLERGKCNFFNITNIWIRTKPPVEKSLKKL